MVASALRTADCLRTGGELRVGQYVLGGRLGEGTFGTVLKAVHARAHEKVAVKVLEKKRLLHADDLERVGVEIRTLKMVNHPNVVRCSRELARAGWGA